MYFIRIEGFVFSDLSHCSNTLEHTFAEIELFISVISVICVVVGITGSSKSSREANLSSGRCKINTREGQHCH